MQFTILTLFPELTEAFFSHGMIKRAIDREMIAARSIDIRSFTVDRHHTVDDKPYGGGPGMIMKPEPLTQAIQAARKSNPGARVIMMSPQGNQFTQARAQALANDRQDLIFICGRYEGVDERISTLWVDEEISMGDFVMTGGELAAMAIIDAVARLIPGVLGKQDSARFDSFSRDRLEFAQYTRPTVFEDLVVPDVLLSGNHGKIRQWRKDSALKRTFLKRPDLFEKNRPTPEEKDLLKQWCRDLEELIDG